LTVDFSFSTHLLHGATIIDQTFESRRFIASALAQQWFGNYIGIKAWYCYNTGGIICWLIIINGLFPLSPRPDLWIRFGLSGHLANLFYKKMFGNNEYRFHLIKV